MSGSLATTTPAITVAQFRGMFPEFDDSSVYLDEVITPWLIIATVQLDPGRWATMYNMGIALFTAHAIVLQRQATVIAQRGGVPGAYFGILQSKSINGVSASYNLSMLLKDAGEWNLTIYGIRFLGYARMFGSGGLQVVGSDATMVTETQLIQGNVLFPFQE